MQSTTLSIAVPDPKNILEMKGFDSNQILLMAGGVALAYGIYAYGESELDEQKKDPGMNVDTDPIIQRIHDTGRHVNQKYPSCQIWDQNYQTFFDTGDAESHISQDACFVKNSSTDNVRYLKSQNDIKYKREDPLADDPASRGICYIGPTGSTLLDIPMTVVNRSPRLCFASGNTSANTGHKFVRNSDHAVFMSPFLKPDGNYPLGEEIELTNNLYRAWSVNNDLDRDAAESTYGKRWRDAQTISFQNPYTGKVVMIPNEEI